MKPRLYYFVALLILALGSHQAGYAQGKHMDPASEVTKYGDKSQNAAYMQQKGMEQQEPNNQLTGSQSNNGVGLGSSTPDNQRQQVRSQQAQFEKDITDNAQIDNAPYVNASVAAGEGFAGTMRHDEFRAPRQVVMTNLTPREAQMSLNAGEQVSYGCDFFDGGTLGGAAIGEVGGSAGSTDHVGSACAGSDESSEAACATRTANMSGALAHNNSPDAKTQAEKACNNDKQGSRGSNAGEDAWLLIQSFMDGQQQYLINVANEDAGAPLAQGRRAAACSSRQPFKTYGNAVWMVQKMYKECYIPMAILFLLPGAIITNTKTLVNFGILGGRDDDVVSPFTGIMRAIIAIFLIPATQLCTSYVIDTANALEDCAKQHVSLPLIYLWIEAQIQTFDPDQQGKLLKNLPNVPMAPYLGKFAGMPAKGAILEQVGGLQDALIELCNECLHMLTIGLNVISAFQLVMICYLFLMGPLAAAFFAWPSIGRDLFRKAFSTWVDGVVVLSLWKFWWNVILLCMTVRLTAEPINPFDVWEVYYLIAFISIMMVVPFNPFDFRPGEIVTNVLGKAEGVAAKVAQSGKGGGSKGGGKSAGGGSPSQPQGE